MDDMDRLLEDASARLDMGWDRDRAKQTMAESAEVINIATMFAKRAIIDMQKNEEDVEEALSELREIINKVNPGGSRKGENPNISRSEAADVLRLLGRINSAYDIKGIVKMSLDLTNQCRIFLEMMDKIDVRYGAEEREGKTDLISMLTTEQLQQVYEWVEENEGTSA